MTLLPLSSKATLVYALFFLLTAYSTPGLATPGIDHNWDTQSFPGGQFQLQATDLRVKVQGGYIRSTRTWTGEHWEFNRRWGNLYVPGRQGTLITGGISVNSLQCRGGASMGIVSNELMRNGTSYRSDELIPDTFYREAQTKDNSSAARVRLMNNRIQKTSGGYSWLDNLGNRIYYNSDGQTTGYSDRNNNKVSFTLNNSGDILHVRDVNDRVILSYDYETITVTLDEPLPDGSEAITANRVTRVTDYSGRSVQYHYNEYNQLERVTDPLGQNWLYGYDDRGFLSSVIDPQERKTEISISSSGTLSSLRFEDGRHYRFSYSGSGSNVREIRTDAAGTVTETIYDSLHQPLRQTINGEEEFSATYITALHDSMQGIATTRNRASGAGSGRCGSTSLGSASISLPPPSTHIESAIIKDRYGEEIHLSYNPKGQVIRRQRKSDNAEQSTAYHNLYDLPITEKDWDGTLTRYQYDERGNLTRLIEAAGSDNERITEYTVDSHGNVLSERSLGDANTATAEYHYSYDDYGNVTAITHPGGTLAFTNSEHPAHHVLGTPGIEIDENGNTRTFNYDAVGNLLAVTDALGRTTHFDYNNSGDLIGLTQPDGSHTEWSVDHAGKPLVVTNALEHSTVLQYGSQGHLQSVTLPSGSKQQLTYNARGQLAWHRDAVGNETRWQYKGARLEHTDYPTFQESPSFDTQGNLIGEHRQSDTLQQNRQYSYDPLGRPIISLDAEGRSTRTAYDKLGRLTAITDAAGGISQLAYDARDNLIRVTDPQGSTTQFSYDASDRLITETRPGGEQRHYSYYPNSQRKTETNGKGEITHYRYDPAGQLIQIKHFASATAQQNGNADKTTTFSYNLQGQLTGYSDGSVTGTHSYNAVGQVVETTIDYGPFSKTHSYTYDADGNRITYTNPEGITYQYRYNANGDFQQLVIPDEGNVTVSRYHWRTPADWLFPGGSRITTVFDGLQRPHHTQLHDPGQNLRASREYTVNNENHITAINSETGHHLYTLDELYRLIAATYAAEAQLNDEQYSYDGVGNRLSDAETSGWQYNANHQLQSIPSPMIGEGQGDAAATTFTYDANGHTTRKETADGTVTTYHYDSSERLRRVEIDGTVVGQYRYDPFGRRISKTTASGSRYFHYDDTGLRAEYDASGNLINEYLYRPGSTWMTNPIFKRDGADNRVHYYYNSHLGQPLKLFDRTGRITWEARSQAFGETEVYTELTENNLRFPGQYFDSETGLFHNWHRDYDPSTGRYIQADPVGMFAGHNYYLYTGANPVAWIDPYGLFCMTPWLKGALAGAAGGLTSGFMSGGGPWGAAAGAMTGALGGAVGGSIGSGLRAAGEGAAAAYSSKTPGGRYHAGRGALIGSGLGSIASDAGPVVGGGVAGLAGGLFGDPAKAFYRGPQGGLAGMLGAYAESGIRNHLDNLLPDCTNDDGEQEC